MITSKNNLKHIIDSLSGEEADEVMSILEQHAPGLFGGDPMLPSVKPPIKPPTHWFRVTVSRKESYIGVFDVEVPESETATAARLLIEDTPLEDDEFGCGDRTEEIVNIDPIKESDVGANGSTVWRLEADEGSPVAS